MHNLSQAAWKAWRTTHGGPAIWTSQSLPSLYICGARCIWTLVCHKQTHQRRTGGEQAVGHHVLLYEFESCAHRDHWVYGHVKLYKCSQALLCTQRPCETAPFRLRYQFHRSVQGAWNGQNSAKVPQWARMQLGIQPTTQFSHGRLVGTPDRHCQKNPGFNVSAAEYSLNPWSPLHTNGRSDCYHKCTTTPTCVCRSGTTIHTFTISAPYTEDRSSASSGDFSDKDLYTKQWRQVQALANQFWTRWSREYLPCLQQRQKWTVPARNLQVV